VTDISRILTLVFTDLADSTALKTQRGDQAVGELITRHRAHVRRLAAESGGRLIDWAGDGCFLTFETPSAAVLFALRLQQVHREEPDLPGVRTGIHMGEVSERPGPDGDLAHPRVEGLAVDLAARISGLAKPGQVLMSSSVADSARQRLEADAFLQPVLWRAHGSYALKGFDEALQIREAGLEGMAPFEAPAASDKAKPMASPATPVTRRRTLPVAIVSVIVLGAAGAYLMWSRAADRSSVAHPGGAASGTQTPRSDALSVPGFGGRPAIAVLPFDNLSPDPTQAFFADGLAEDLITRLSTWRAFPVIARNSSFQYRGGNKDLKRVSAELGVRYVVEGSVSRAGDRIRVTAQLIDAPSGEHVWAETYDRQVTDVFALQDEISSTIAASLVGDLNRAEAERARQRGTENLEAWSLYELGVQSLDRQGSKDLAEARGLFERAVTLDPHFATALGRLALTQLWEVGTGNSDAPDQKVEAALAIARNAVAIDPRDPVGQVAQAWAYLLRGDLKNGLDSSHRAVELNPSMPEAWTWLGWIQTIAGDPEAGIASSERARRLSPQGPSVAQVEDNLAMAYFEMGRYTEALDAGRKLVALRPAYVWGYGYVAMSAAALGRIDEARAAVSEARRVEPRVSQEMFQRGIGVSRPEIDARRNAALRKAGLE
jgi:TolB-like protein/class 3 adenylate cyclase/Flp pilus assembly protein TadD